MQMLHFELVLLFNQQLPHEMTINGNIESINETPSRFTCDVHVIIWNLSYICISFIQSVTGAR